MQGIGVGYMLFGKMLFVCLNRNVQPLVGNNPALVKWVFRRVLPGTKRNKFVILLEVWKWQLRCPAYRFQRGLPPPLQFLCELRSEEHTSELQSRVDLVCRLL